MPIYRSARPHFVSLAVKDPDAVIDYQVDMSNYLQDGETLTTASFILEPGVTLVKDSESFTDTTGTVWLSAGDENIDYTLIFRFTTSNSRSDDRSFIVPVRQS